MKQTPFPKLAELQDHFWQLITAPEGVAAGAAALRDRGVLASPELAFLVRGDARLDPRERLDVYADMYFYRLRDCLAEDFPKLAAQQGPDAFHNLVTDYLLAHPSRHFSLRELGRALPDFVAGRAGDVSLLADLARLEWARVDVFDETDAPALGRGELLAGGGDPERFRLRLVPAARLLRLDRACLPLWKQLDAAAEGDSPPHAEASGEAGGVCVWRRGAALLHRSLAPDEAACLARLEAGPTSLATLGETLLSAVEGNAGDEAAERFASLLAGWADDELLAAGRGGFVDTPAPRS